MRRGQWAERPSLLYDASTNGVLTRKQLLHTGLADGTIRQRCTNGGPWTRILPGVVLLSNGYPSPLQRMTAAQTYCGPESLLTGGVALDQYGYGGGRSTNDVHVLIPESTRHASVSFVRAERTWRMPDAVAKGSLRCAPLVRSLIDYGRSCTREDQCAAVLAEAIRRGEVTVEELAIELAEGPTRHSALTRKGLFELERATLALSSFGASTS